MPEKNCSTFNKGICLLENNTWEDNIFVNVQKFCFRLIFIGYLIPFFVKKL